MYPTIYLTPDPAVDPDDTEVPDRLDVKRRPIDRLVADLTRPWR